MVNAKLAAFTKNAGAVLPAGRPDQQAGDRGADQPGAVEDRGVEADRVGQQLRADHLRDEGLPHRGVDGGDRAQPAGQQRTRATAATPSVATRMPEHQREHAHQRLGDQQHPALVVAVGQHPAVHAQQQRRAELQGGDQAERDAAVVGELQHQPVLADPLHPGAGVADQVGRGVDAGSCAPAAPGTSRGRGPALGPVRWSGLVRVTHWPACP